MTSGRLTPDPADALADDFERRGIGTPAAILLDAHRPLLPLMRQGAIFLGPLLGALLGRRRIGALQQTLHDLAAYDRFAARLAGEHRHDPR